MAHVLIAGATGHLGREVLSLLHATEHRVSVLTRRRTGDDGLGLQPGQKREGDVTLPASLVGACRDVDVVFSCIGAPTTLTPSFNSKSYWDIDARGNLNLLQEAVRAGVSKFVYVASFVGAGFETTAYVRAHEAVVVGLEESGLDYAVVRPTGFFYAFTPFFEMARSGVAAAIGPGHARTNPIHERDVAQVCVDAIDGHERELFAGGPEVFTRRQVIELAFDALEKPSRIVSVPLAAARVASQAIRPIDVRLYDFLDFAQRASSYDAVTEVRGTRRLRDYFSSLAGVMGRS